MKTGINNLWPTPILFDQITNFKLLEDFIQEIFTIIDVYHPPPDSQQINLFNLDNDSCNQFKEQIVDKIFNKYLTITNNETLDDYKDYVYKTTIRPIDGTIASYHNHPHSIIAAVFYLLCEDGKGGNINIFDPRINVGRGYGNRFKNLFGNKLFSPKTGDVLVLPSFVYHCNDYFNGSARLVLTVDFMHKDLFLNGGIDY